MTPNWVQTIEKVVQSSDRLEQELGPLRLLGHGTEAAVYECVLDPSRVLRVTDREHEAAYAQYFLRRPGFECPHLPVVKSVAKLPPHYFAVVVERLCAVEPLYDVSDSGWGTTLSKITKAESTAYGESFEAIDSGVHPVLTAERRDAAAVHLNFYTGPNPKLWKPVLLATRKIIDWCYDNSIMVCDMHPHNWAARADGTLVMQDIGHVYYAAGGPEWAWDTHRLEEWS